MGQDGSKEKHFSKEAYPNGRSSYRMEELLQSSAYTTWATNFEASDAFKKYQTLPEKLPREVERDLLDRHIKEHYEEFTAAVTKGFDSFSVPTIIPLNLGGRTLSLHYESSTMCKVYGPQRTKEPTLVGLINNRLEYMSDSSLDSLPS